MKTKIGEIKSVADFFEVAAEHKNAPGTQGWGSVIEQTWRCKLCGDEMSGMSTKGACDDRWDRVDKQAERHIELHKDISLLGLSDPIEPRHM